MNWWIKKNARGRLSLHMRSEGEAQAGVIPLERVWSAVVWPDSGQGYALTGCQAKQSKRAFLLSELQSREWKDLVRKLAQDKKALGAELIFHEGGKAGEAYRDRANQLDQDEGLTELESWGGRSGLCFDAAPYQDLPAFFAVGIARGWVSERLSMMPKLEVLKTQLSRLKSLSPDQVVEELPDLQAYRALVFLLSAFDAYPMQTNAARLPLTRQPADELTGI